MNKIITVLGLLILALTSCQFEKEHHHEEETPKLLVTHPMRKDTSVTREYVCQIHASRHIELRALERGYLQKTFVDEGQTVRKGQAMFKIMPNVYEAELLTYKAEAEKARIEYENTRTLTEKNIVSQNELALAKANLDRANAEVVLAETHLGFTNINAPFSGIMDHLHVREGSLLEEGELLTSLSDISKMWVYFNLPEAEYLDYVTINKNQRQKRVELEMANGQIFPHPGIIETIEGEFNNETGNIEFRATFPNPERILRHGETGNVLMSIPYNDVLIIPQKATFEIMDKKYVFVVNEDHKLEQRNITIAEELPHLYLVSDGLDETDKILLEGLRKVRNGQEIEMDFQSPEKALAELELFAE
jgi:membrane fusion protein (multidrug efflux system)